VGDDGRLLVWSPAGDDVEVRFAHGSPLTGIEVLASTDHAIVHDAHGGVWEVSPTGALTQVREPGEPVVTTMVASPRGDYLALGTGTGEVWVYTTSPWRVVATLEAEGAIRAIGFDPRGRDLMVVSKAGRSQFGHVTILALGAARRIGWSKIAIEAQDVAYAPDGETLGFACADGGTWLYAVATDRWTYARDHDTEALNLRFAPDGKQIVSGDRRGVIIVRDVAATLQRNVSLPPQEGHR
jgi:WD40 repeat protein